MRISVIIPTKNRHADLLLTVEQVLKQSRLPEELIVVDQNITDMVEADLRKQMSGTAKPRLIYIRDATILGLPAARNRGFRASSGDIICYFDDDATPATDYLEQIERGFREMIDWDGLCGRFTESINPSRLRRIGKSIFRRGLFRDDRSRLASLKKRKRVRLLPGAAFCLRRIVLERFSFDESLKGYALGEDVDFFLRAGREFRFGAIPSAFAHHRRSEVNRMDRDEVNTESRDSIAYLRRRHRRHFVDDLCYLWLRAGLKIESLASPKNLMTGAKASLKPEEY